MLPLRILSSLLVTPSGTVGRCRVWDQLSRHSCGSCTIPSSADKHFHHTCPQKDVHMTIITLDGYVWLPVMIYCTGLTLWKQFIPRFVNHYIFVEM